MTFVDANVWIAMRNKNDLFHSRAIEILNNLVTSKKIYVTDGVIFEVINFINKRIGNLEAKKALELFTEDIRIEIILNNPFLWNETLNSFRNQFKSDLSLVDCQILTAMKQKNISTLYSFDSGFDKVKFVQREF